MTDDDVSQMRLRLRNSQDRRDSASALTQKSPPRDDPNQTDPRYKAISKRLAKVEQKLSEVDEYSIRVDNELSAAVRQIDVRVSQVEVTVNTQLKSMSAKIDESTATILSRLDALSKANPVKPFKERPIHIPPFTTSIMFADSNGNNFIPFLNRMPGYTHHIRVTSLEDIPRKIGLIECSSSKIGIQMLIYFATTNAVSNGKSDDWISEQLKLIDAAARARFADAPGDLKQFLISPPPRSDTPEMTAANDQLREKLKRTALPSDIRFDEAAELFATDPSTILEATGNFKGIHMTEEGRAILADVVHRIIDGNLLRQSFTSNFRAYGPISGSERLPKGGRGYARGGRGQGRWRGRGRGHRGGNRGSEEA